MKHLLNNISEEEKNRIREQHTGGMRIATDKFKMLVETKQGDVKPYLNENITGKGLMAFEFGNTRPGQTEPKYRLVITGPAKWVSNHHITIPVKTIDKSKEGEIITKCTENYGFYFNYEGVDSEKVFFTKEGENILKPEIERLCAQFVSNDGGDDVSNIA